MTGKEESHVAAQGPVVFLRIPAAASEQFYFLWSFLFSFIFYCGQRVYSLLPNEPVAMFVWV